MAISFECACGQEITVPEAHAGKVEKCPSCRMSVMVPEPPPSDPQKPRHRGR
jgi:hypothetical protein